MAHGVRTGWLRDASLEPCIFDGLLEDRFMEVVSVLFSCDLVGVMAGCREHPLPAPLLACVRILAFQGIGKAHATQALPQVFLMLALHGLQVSQERVLRSGRKHRVAIFVALASANDNLVPGKVNVLDPK